MNQIDAIKKLLQDYAGQAPADEVRDTAKAAAYIEAHKPPGVGRVTAVILQPILAEIKLPSAVPPVSSPGSPSVSLPALPVVPPVAAPSKPVSFIKRLFGRT